MIKTGIAFLCALVLVCVAAPGWPQASSTTSLVSSFLPGDPLYGRRVSQMTVLDNSLWLRLDDGALVSLRLHDGRRQVVIERGVVYIERGDGRLYFLIARGKDLWVETMERGRRRAITRVPSTDRSRAPVILAAKGKLAVIAAGTVRTGGVGTRPAPLVQIYDQSSRTWRAVTVRMPAGLDDPASRAGGRWAFGRVNSSLTRDGVGYYLGVNMGEWGGDLYRIGLSDGAMAHVPLGEDTNVQDVQPDPLRDDCVIVATGLAHMGGLEGSVRRVCGLDTTQLLSHPATSGLGLSGTAPVYRVIPLKSGYWFTSERGFFEADAKGGDVRPVTPTYAEFGGLMMDKSHPGLILVKYDGGAPPPVRYYPIAASR